MQRKDSAIKIQTQHIVGLINTSALEHIDKRITIDRHLLVEEETVLESSCSGRSPLSHTRVTSGVSLLRHASQMTVAVDGRAGEEDGEGKEGKGEEEEEGRADGSGRRPTAAAAAAEAMDCAPSFARAHSASTEAYSNTQWGSRECRGDARRRPAYRGSADRGLRL